MDESSAARNFALELRSLVEDLARETCSVYGDRGLVEDRGKRSLLVYFQRLVFLEETKDADDSMRAHQRPELEGTVRQRAGTVAGSLLLLESPAPRHRVGKAELRIRRPGRHQADISVFRQQQRRVAPKGRVDLRDGRP